MENGFQLNEMVTQPFVKLTFCGKLLEEDVLISRKSLAIRIAGTGGFDPDKDPTDEKKIGSRSDRRGKNRKTARI